VDQGLLRAKEDVFRGGTLKSWRFCDQANYANGPFEAESKAVPGEKGWNGEEINKGGDPTAGGTSH